MIGYAYYHSYIPWHALARDFSQRKTVFDAIVGGRWSAFGFRFYPCLSLCAWSFSFFSRSSTSLVVQMECRIFFVSYSCNVISYHLWVSTTQIRRGREPTIATGGSYAVAPSFVAAVDAPVNDQDLSTQARRSALTHFAISPLLVLLLLVSSITSLRELAELSSRCFQVPTLLPFPIRVHKLLLRRGNIHPTLFPISRPKFDMAANQPF